MSKFGIVFMVVTILSLIVITIVSGSARRQLVRVKRPEPKPTGSAAVKSAEWLQSIRK